MFGWELQKKKQSVDKDNKFEEFYHWILDGVNEPPEKHAWYQEPEDVLKNFFNSILWGVIVHIEQKFKTMEEFGFVDFVESDAFSHLRKKFPMKCFHFWM